MAIPKARELMGKRLKNKIIKDDVVDFSEKSIYLAMKYDYDRGCLSNYKVQKFLELRDKYEEL